MSASQADVSELRADDRERMQRLSEEVRGRLMEMALITTRTLGIELERDAVVKFLPVQLSSEDSRDGLALQILERASGPNCMCYIDPPGICKPCHVEPIKVLQNR